MESQNQTLNYQYYLLDQDFKKSSNLDNYIEESQNFYNGNQYPNANYKNMIRVTLNIVSFAAILKASKICATPIYIAFTADDIEVDTTALRQFDEYNCTKLKMKASNFQSALNGFVNGTEITYIRWDDDDTTYKGIYKGGLVEEHVDPRHFAVADPSIQEIQNQQWVMIDSDCSVGALKKVINQEYKDKKEREDLYKLLEGDADRSTVNGKDKSLINSALCQMFTRFFKKNGEVYFECSTKSVDLFKYPHPLSRTVSKSVIKKVVDEYRERLNKQEGNPNGDLIDGYDIDFEDIAIPSISRDDFTEAEYKEEKEKFYLYPFAVFRPFMQNGSFYGRSDSKQLIPVQKGLNFAASMILQCAQNNAYNKIIVKPDALQGQVITNEPGQVLYDYSGFQNTWGIKYMESQPMPNDLMKTSNDLLSMTRLIYGFNEVMDGSISNQDLSGYAVQLMMKQANTPIEQQQQLFWTYNEEKAAIRLMYYKHYVDKAKYTFELTDSEYDGEKQAGNILLNGLNKGMEIIDEEGNQAVDTKEAKELLKRKVQKKKVGSFNKEDIWGTNIDIAVEAMQGLADSELAEAQFFDNLILNGGINNISPELLNMYLQANPNISPRTKASMNQVIENLKMSENEQLKAQYQELLGKTEQIMAYAKQLESANGYQSQYLKNLQSEFTNKINAMNKINKALVNDLDQYRGQSVTEGEAKSNNSRGIAGSNIGPQS